MSNDKLWSTSDVNKALREQADHMRTNAAKLKPMDPQEARARELAALYVEEIAIANDIDERLQRGTARVAGTDRLVHSAELASIMPSRERLREQIAADPDIEASTSAPVSTVTASSHCDWCAPEYGCFNGSKPCSKGCDVCGAHPGRCMTETICSQEREARDRRTPASSIEATRSAQSSDGRCPTCNTAIAHEREVAEYRVALEKIAHMDLDPVTMKAIARHALASKPDSAGGQSGKGEAK